MKHKEPAFILQSLLFRITGLERLTKEKKAIIDEHADKILNAYTEMAKTVDHAMRDSNIIVDADVSFLSSLRTLFKFERKNSTGLNGQEKVQYIKMEYDARKDAFDETKDILRSGRASLVKDIDEQLELCKKEIEQIDELINCTVDPQKKEEYVRKKERVTDRSF